MTDCHGVVSPSWMPGTTALTVQEGGVSKLVALVFVGFDASAERYDSVEHFVTVDTPAAAIAPLQAPYPTLSPNVPDLLGASPTGAITATPIPDVKTLSAFKDLVNTTFDGTKVHYFVAGIDYFVGRPVKDTPLSGAREIRWVEKITLDYGGGVSATAYVHAEKPTVNADGKRVIQVHQVQPFNLHWPPPQSATCGGDVPGTLGEVFNRTRLNTGAQQLALLYCRASVYDVGLVNDGKDWAPTDPQTRIVPVGDDLIGDIYPLPPLRE